MNTTPNSEIMAKGKADGSPDSEAERLILWGAARAGVIVLTPFLGTVALTANEVYMVMRIATCYGIDLSASACGALLSGLAGAFFGSTLATLLPLPPLQIPIAVGVTYAIGRIAQQWIRDGMPADLIPYRHLCDRLYEEGKARVKEFMAHPQRHEPLGDESPKTLALWRPGIAERKENRGD
ncbi:MAG: hypothetical protein N3A66_01975 [Planctomycetota bacterium]|nr:hypothetical protein [Planctomycetota bacterium]